jgi:hypothetical protein
MNTFTIKRALCGPLVALLLSAGCSKDVSRPRVQGTVTFQGNPVGSKTLALFSEGAPGEFFAQKIPIGPDGTFSGEVPAPGTYKVVIEESLAVQEGARRPAGDQVKVPDKYRSVATTDLTWTIEKGDNSRDLVLSE